MPLLNKRLLNQSLEREKASIPSSTLEALKKLFQATIQRIESGKFKKEESEKVPFLQKMFELLGYKLHENLEFEYSTQGRSIDGVLGAQTQKGRDVEVAIEWKGIDTKNLDGGKAGETPVSQMWDYMGKVGAEIGIVGNFLEFRLYTLKTKQSNFHSFFIRELTQNESKLLELTFLLSPATLLKKQNKASLLETLISQSEAQQEQITKRFYNDYKQRRLNLFEHLVENNTEPNQSNINQTYSDFKKEYFYQDFVIECLERACNLCQKENIKDLESLSKKASNLYGEIVIKQDNEVELIPEESQIASDLYGLELYTRGLINYNSRKDRILKIDNYLEFVLKLESQNYTNFKLLLLEKAQKILDRLIFIMFCEDGFLLPSGIIKQVFETARNSFGSETKIWEQFKGLFEAIDKGSQSPKINAFNGGLFSEDLELNSLIIKDEIWQDLIKLAKYDFESDLNVNILGHIFEQSISDIEEIKNEIEGENTDKKKSKRKKDGIYYTPEYITDYIVSETIGSWLNQESNQLENIKVLDPAGGSGAFPNQVHNFLAKKHVEQIKNKAENQGFDPNLVDIDEKLIDKSILQNNIFMVDLQPESVEIAKLSLWLKTAKKDQKLDNLDKNIKCGNSLISDLELAGNSAFDWNQEFPEVMTSGGFDVVVGNPPYGVDFDSVTKKYLETKFPNVPDFEIYIYFISQGLSLLEKGGILSYIFPNTFLATQTGIKYRQWLLDNFDILRITDLSKDVTFEDANVRTCIFTIRKSKTENNISEFWEIVPGEKKFQKKFEFDVEFLKNNVSNWLTLFSYSHESNQIIERMKLGFKVGDVCEVSQGLIPYDKYRGHDEFTIKNRIWHADYKKDDTYKKELKGRDIDKYTIVWNGELWISYGKWLGAPRDPKFFTSPRILVREIAETTLYCSFLEEEYYNTGSLINIIQHENNIILLKYILGVLNTKLIGWYHKNTSPKANKGLFPKILVGDVRNLPIPKATTEQQTQIAELVDQIMVLKTQSQNLTNSFLKLITTKYKPNTISTKLKKWSKLEITDFLIELKKQKAVIGGLSAESELLEYFDEQKGKVLEIEREVEKVDGEIEGLVRGFYGV